MRKGDKLTVREEAFCLNVLDGLSYIDSYIKAGYSSKSSRRILAINAYLLSRRPKIRKRLAELQEKLCSDKVMSIVERRERLSEIARQSQKQDSIKAIDILNKMDKLYSDNQSINIDNRSIEVVVSSAEAQALVDKLINNERKELTEDSGETLETDTSNCQIVSDNIE